MISADFVCLRADEEAWLAARRTGIGSSDAPVLVLGRAYGRTPLDLFMEKVGTIPPVRPESEGMKWGRTLQQGAIDQLCDEANLVHFLTPEALYRNRERPWLLSTPDCWLASALEVEGPQTCGEVKLRGVLDWDEGLPEFERIQAQHQMMVLGLPFCYVAALGGGYGGMRFLWARVERDEAFINGCLIPLCESFWMCVQAKEPPPVGPDDSKAVAALAGTPIEGKVIQLDASWIEHADELAEAEVEAAEACKVVETLKNGIKLAMGDAVEAVLPNGVRFAYKPNTRGVRSFRRIG